MMLMRNFLKAKWASCAVTLMTSCKRATTELTQQMCFSDHHVKSLASIVGDRNVSRGVSILHNHSKDESYHPNCNPDAVVWVESVFQLSGVARFCYENNIAMIPFGSGTGLEGGCIPHKGGIVINLSKLDQITGFHPEDFDVTVQAGVTKNYLNSFLKSHGLWFPIDPGADASLCGMCATNASGTNAVKYGAMKQNVLNLEVVLPNGDVLNTAGELRRSRKSSAGYNLTELLVGSEGTLAFITSATLKLWPLPSFVTVGICHFRNVQAAVDTVILLLQCALPLARIELLDKECMVAVNNFSHMALDESPSLFIELHGSSQTEINDLVAQVYDLLKDNSDVLTNWTDSLEERNQLWKVRHNLYYSILAAKPGKIGLMTDACVPLSNLPALVTETQHDLFLHNLYGPCFGHVGDGNFHSVIMFNPSDEEERKATFEVAANLVRRAQSLGGTCTGEHGIGLGKIEYLKNELSSKTIDLFRSIKSVFDAKNLMNPGKII